MRFYVFGILCNKNNNDDDNGGGGGGDGKCGRVCCPRWQARQVMSDSSCPWRHPDSSCRSPAQPAARSHAPRSVRGPQTRQARSLPRAGSREPIARAASAPRETQARRAERTGSPLTVCSFPRAPRPGHLMAPGPWVRAAASQALRGAALRAKLFPPMGTNQQEAPFSASH